jgi:hypothetical protein
MSQSGRPLLRNVYNKNSYFSGNGVQTSSVSVETNTLTIAASETLKLKNSTRCLLDRPADGYDTDTDRSRPELGVEQSEEDARQKRSKEIADGHS